MVFSISYPTNKQLYSVLYKIYYLYLDILFYTHIQYTCNQQSSIVTIKDPPHQKKQPKKKWLNSQSHFHPLINPSIFPPRLQRLCPVRQFPRRGTLALGTSRCLSQNFKNPKGFQNWANRSQQLCVVYQLFFSEFGDGFLYIPSPLARISEASTAPYASNHRTWGGMTGRLKHMMLLGKQAIPQFSNQQFLHEFLLFGGLPGVCSRGMLVFLMVFLTFWDGWWLVAFSGVNSLSNLGIVYL